MAGRVWKGGIDAGAAVFVVLLLWLVVTRERDWAQPFFSLGGVNASSSGGSLVLFAGDGPYLNGILGFNGGSHPLIRDRRVYWKHVFHYRGLEYAGHSSWTLVARIDLLLFPTGLLAFIWLERRVKRWIKRRPDEGVCAACGYDLRGGAAGAACPECGARPEGTSNGS